MTVALHETNNLPSKIQFAQALAESNLLPKQYRQQPANVLLAIELGEALGIPPIQAINGIHVVEGKPSASADLIASLIRRAGHKLRVTVDDHNGVAVAQLIRADDPDFTYESRWDLAKARAAGLAGKQVWKNYTGQMLRSRAITEVARMGASDALYGVIYTPEELGADDGPQVSVRQVQEPAPAQVTSLQDAVAAHRQATDGITGEQKAALSGLIGQLGLQKDEYLTAVAGFVGRQVGGTNELSQDEAATVIAALSADPAPDETVDESTGEIHEAELVAESEWPEVAEVPK